MAQLLDAMPVKTPVSSTFAPVETDVRHETMAPMQEEQDVLSAVLSFVQSIDWTGLSKRFVLLVLFFAVLSQLYSCWAGRAARRRRRAKASPS